MSTPKQFDDTASVGEGERGAVENYLAAVNALLGARNLLVPSHAAFLARLSAVLPTLTKGEYKRLARALHSPRLSTLARAVAETRPDLLE